MRGFAGFRGGREPSVPLPDAFFSILLPQIDNLTELKVTLHLFSLLYHRRGTPKAVALSELEKDETLLLSLKTVRGPRPAEDFLREGLERAVARGTLLLLTLHGGRAQIGTVRTEQTVSDQPTDAAPARPSVIVGQASDVHIAEDCWYFLNTRASRQALRQLASTKTTLKDTVHHDILSVELVRIHRPNVFSLYEQNIGALTPLLADELRDAELTYPADWMTDAIRLAVESNRRNWRYIQGILRRWEAEGKDNGIHRSRDSEDPSASKYTTGRYGHLVET